MLYFALYKEEKLKTKLNKMILERKKKIYSSLTETIEDNMQKCYKGTKDDVQPGTIIKVIHKNWFETVFCFIVEAAKISGKDTLKKMRETIEKHVRESKHIMFEG